MSIEERKNPKKWIIFTYKKINIINRITLKKLTDACSVNADSYPISLFKIELNTKYPERIRFKRAITKGKTVGDNVPFGNS